MLNSPKKQDTEIIKEDNIEVIVQDSVEVLKKGDKQGILIYNYSIGDLKDIRNKLLKYLYLSGFKEVRIIEVIKKGLISDFINGNSGHTYILLDPFSIVNEKIKENFYSINLDECMKMRLTRNKFLF